jgi:AcrR family transcriptional regulator
MGKIVNRPYRSPLRAAQAASTREAVIAAAARLFADQGYVATSIDEIAERAGVSRATVFTSVGGKGALLKTALDVAIVGDDEPVSLPERLRSKAIRAETDPHLYLALYAELVGEISGRVAKLYEAVRGAAGADSEARDLWDAQQAQRRRGAANVVGDVIAKGGLRPGLDEETAADTVWALNDPGLYHQLVNGRGWPPDRYAVWLGETLARLLLAG